MANLQQLEINFSPEIWKDISGFEEHYQVSNLGRVKSLGRYMSNNRDNYKLFYKAERILKNKLKGNGYLFVSLCLNGNITYHHVHRLVAAAFIPNPENKPHVNHLNLDKADNRIENLEWCTQSENMVHAYSNKTFKNNYHLTSGIHNYYSMPVLQLSIDGEYLFIWGSMSEAAKFYKISDSSIGQSIRNKGKCLEFVWRTISKEYYFDNKDKYSQPPISTVDKRKRDLSKAIERQKEIRIEKASRITKDILIAHGIECLKVNGNLHRKTYEKYAQIYKAPGYKYIINRFTNYDAFKEAARQP